MVAAPTSYAKVSSREREKEVREPDEPDA